MNASAVIAAFWNGMACMGLLVAALFFLRFWRRTTDPLFAAFSIAFVVLAIEQAVTPLLHAQGGPSATPYVIRLAAFLAIAVAILRKNFGR